MDRSEFTSAFIDQLPQLDELTELLSAPLAGGTHLILTNDNPWDNSIYQFYLDREGKIIDSAVHDVGHSLGHEFNTGDVVGAGVLLGSIPENLTFVRHTRCPYRLDFFFSDLSADPDHESHVLSFYRHVWPGVPVEVEALSTIVGPFSPEIVARIEL
ncbi:hypothetical protein, partial [Corynebacterium sp.]|uniref:hypothetical protein n=1 Tax=Corynebacterium sp. TaxID=1720 RepID=UPI0026E1080D